MNPVLLTANAEAATNPANINIFPILIILLIAYFIGNTIYKGIKKKKIISAFDNIALGDKVVFTNGMTGTVVALSEDEIEVELSRATHACFQKWAISSINGEKL